MDDSAGAASLILFFALLFVEIVLCGFGRAIQQLNAATVREKVQKGERKAEKILSIMEQPGHFVNTLQFITILIHLVMGGFFIQLFRDYLFSGSGLGKAVSYLLTGFLILLLLLVVCNLAPKKIARKYAKEWVSFFVGPITVLVAVFSPLMLLFDRIANLLALIFGVKVSDLETDVTEEEIISMVNEGHEQGVLQESEARMITNIFELSDKDAKDIMTHRSNIIGIEAGTTLQDAVDFMLEEKNSRYPVYIENIDHIIGMIHVKDACRMLDSGKNGTKPIKSVKNLIREAKFIPETRSIDTLFRSMQSLKTHMVIVIDEYGQTAGLVAMEDILEEIVGNILDEYDDEESFIQEKGEDCYEIEGLTPLDELGSKLGIDFSKEEFETLNGLIVSRLEHIPQDDDRFTMEYGGYEFKILSVENKVIKNVLVTKQTIRKENIEKGEQ
jgi:putative hemolysin